MLDGAAQGAEAVRTIVVTIRTLYGDSHEFHYAGPCGNNGWLEDYIAQVRGKPLGCVVLVNPNAAGQTSTSWLSYRPRSSLLLFSRLLGEKLPGTPYASSSLPVKLKLAGRKAPVFAPAQRPMSAQTTET